MALANRQITQSKGLLIASNLLVLTSLSDHNPVDTLEIVTNFIDKCIRRFSDTEPEISINTSATF